MGVLDQYPDMKVLVEIDGEASATKAQEEMLKALPSLDKVDVVLTHGGSDSIGIVNAFEQSGYNMEDMPIITGDDSAEFIHWWIDAKAKGYETYSVGTSPGIGGGVVWAAINILNGEDVPTDMLIALVEITQDEVENYADMQPGTIASPDFTNDFTMEKIIIPARNK
jgi:ribose transport system substrate-binding protein